MQTVEELTELEARLHAAQESQTVVETSPGQRREMQSAAEEARATEIEARLTVRTAEERANAVRGRADSLRRAAAAERDSRLRASAARAARQHAAEVAAATTLLRCPATRRPVSATAAASRVRDRLAAERLDRAGAMTAARTEVTELNSRINALTESLHRDEVAKAQAELRIEQLEQMVLEQFGICLLYTSPSPRD